MFFRVICFCLCLVQLTAGIIDLSLHETSLYSQNGEDGVIAKLVRTVGTTSNYCVELGAADGITHSNTFLLKLQGWKSLSLDRSYEVPAYSLHKEFITAENINALFDKYKVPTSLDLLSIDFDYNTFHIWKALDEAYKPAIVAVAVNGVFAADVDKVAQYHPFYVGDGTDYFGASILALYRLGRTKGYSLVYAEQSGCTLFFVRDDLVADKGLQFKDMNDVQRLYHASVYTYTHDPLNRAFTSAEEMLR